MPGKTAPDKEDDARLIAGATNDGTFVCNELGDRTSVLAAAAIPEIQAGGENDDIASDGDGGVTGMADDDCKPETDKSLSAAAR